MREPQIHSHVVDCLPDEHPLARNSVFCLRCGVLVHAINNECMQTWFETGLGNFCMPCFVVEAIKRDDATTLEDEWGLA